MAGVVLLHQQAGFQNSAIAKKGNIIASGRRMFALVCEELVDNSLTTGPLLRNRIDDWPSHVSLPNNVI
jgi:hypothetical protein